MARHRRQNRQRQRVVPTPEATAMLHGDYPSVVKQQFRLLAKGARLMPQRCLVCGKHEQGMYQEVWLPRTLSTPLPELGVRPTPYWVCRAHHADPPPDAELVALLARRQGQRRR